ncbi:MAG: hypothetical protein LIR50_05455 [Bacillota bacterium]|nr:hypothetical protein [Bacillota bacterium]
MMTEIRHFKNYKTQIGFCSGILKEFQGNNILLLGSDQFVKDIINTNKNQIELIEQDNDIDEKEKSSLITSEYLYALVEEDSIKELHKFKDKIKYTAYILENDEDNKIFNEIEDKHTYEYYDTLDSIIEEYIDMLNYVDTKQNRKEILVELFDLGYRTGEIETKLNIGYGIIDEAEKEINDLE